MGLDLPVIARSCCLDSDAASAAVPGNLPAGQERARYLVQPLNKHILPAKPDDLALAVDCQSLSRGAHFKALAKLCTSSPSGVSQAGRAAKHQSIKAGLGLYTLQLVRYVLWPSRCHLRGGDGLIHKSRFKDGLDGHQTHQLQPTHWQPVSP